MAPCKLSWRLLNSTFLCTGIVGAILRRKFFNQTSLEPRGQKARSTPAPTSVELCSEGTMPTTPQGRRTSGSPEADRTRRTQPGLGHCPCLCQGHLLAIPGNAKIPSSHCSSHFDICGLGRTEERNSHTGSTASRGSSARTQETSKQEVTPVLLPRVLRQPGCPDTAWATQASAPSGTHCNELSADAAQLSHTQLQATDWTPRTCSEE